MEKCDLFEVEYLYHRYKNPMMTTSTELVLTRARADGQNINSINAVDVFVNADRSPTIVSVNNGERFFECKKVIGNDVYEDFLFA